MSGAFITLEGGDGSGKSTQAELLQAWLEEQGRTVVRTREPGGTELGVEIRRLVQHTEGHIAPRAEALLYAADRAHHVATLVRPALERGEVVLQDRYLDSSVAYQGAGRELDVADVEAVARWATRDLRPHLTVVLDVDPAEGLGRFEGRDRIEAESLDFHQRARQAFLDLAKADPDHYLVLDARDPVDDLAAAVRARVEPLLGQVAR